MSSRICTLHDLQTVYSLEDALLLHEILSVDNFNERQARKRQM
ncbi:hypothetical protein [Wielerella bovis]|nr:hypothetical protein [Wielerella bovis]